MIYSIGPNILHLLMRLDHYLVDVYYKYFTQSFIVQVYPYELYSMCLIVTKHHIIYIMASNIAAFSFYPPFKWTTANHYFHLQYF